MWMDGGSRIRVLTGGGEIRDFVWKDLIEFKVYAGVEPAWLRRSGNRISGLVERAASEMEDYSSIFPESSVPRSIITPFFSPSGERIAFVEQGYIHLCSLRLS
jgi:hypothetical protein